MLRHETRLSSCEQTVVSSCIVFRCLLYQLTLAVLVYLYPRSARNTICVSVCVCLCVCVLEFEYCTIPFDDFPVSWFHGGEMSHLCMLCTFTLYYKCATSNWRSSTAYLDYKWHVKNAPQWRSDNYLHLIQKAASWRWERHFRAWMTPLRFTLQTWRSYTPASPSKFFFKNHPTTQSPTTYILCWSEVDMRTGSDRNPHAQTSLYTSVYSNQGAPLWIHWRSTLFTSILKAVMTTWHIFSVSLIFPKLFSAQSIQGWNTSVSTCVKPRSIIKSWRWMVTI